MRQTIGTFAIFLGSVSFTFAAPVFDSFVVDNGQISGCPENTTCTVLVEGNGFLQQEVNDGTNVHVQTIITDTGVTGSPSTLPFADESFIRMGSVNGIAGKQRSTEANFSSTTELLTGWAAASNKPTINIMQQFADNGTAVNGDEFSNSFSVAVFNDNSGNLVGRKITADQSVGLGDGSTTTTDAQNFALRLISGSALSTDGTVTLGSGNDAETATWISGDELMVTWVGQKVDTGSQGLSIFGFEGVENTTTETGASAFSTSSTDLSSSPFDWDVVFGEMPTM